MKDRKKEELDTEDKAVEKIPFTGNGEINAKENDMEFEDEGKIKEEKKSFWLKLTQNKEYRRNYFLTINLIASFFALGWVAGQAGPSFLDWKLITNVHIDRASAFFTTGGIGYLVGTLLTGYLFDRMKDKILLVVVGLLGMGITTAAIPFSYIYELMVFMHLARGIAGGILDTSGNTLVSNTWGSDGRMFMQALHFGFAFGGAVSPLALAPFLTPGTDQMHHLTDAVNETNNQNSSSTINSTLSRVNMTGPESVERESNLYIAYTITAMLSILCAIPAFIICIRDHRLRKEDTGKMKTENAQHEQINKHPVKMTKGIRIIVTIVLALIFCFYCAVEESFVSFLSTFCVRWMKWTKVRGAMVTAVFWAAFSTGRLAGIFLVLIFAPVTLIFIHATLEIFGLAGILLSAMFDFHIGIWIFTPILGFAMSVIFPSIFTWTEMSFMKVTGRISSLFLIMASTGGSVNPIVLGKIMEDYSDMWYVYLLCMQAVVFYVTLFVALFLSKKIVKSRQSLTETEIELNANNVMDSE